MEHMIAALAVAALSSAAALAALNAPRVSRWLVRRGARLYPGAKSERFEEEWMAHLAMLSASRRSMLRHGLGCVGTGLRRGDIKLWTIDGFATAIIVVIEDFFSATDEWLLNFRRFGTVIYFLTLIAVTIPLGFVTLPFCFTSWALSFITTSNRPQIIEARKNGQLPREMLLFIARSPRWLILSVLRWLKL